MINENNEPVEGSNENSRIENNSQLISETQNSISQTEENSNEEVESNTSVSDSKTNLQSAKKKNPYKIAFFSLGGIILLGSASFFGYKYYKEHYNKPIIENICLDTDTKIYDAYKDAVVMVRHRYGYFAKINGKEIQLNVPEANEEIIYGTAFFVDEKGNMISNSHVLEPWNSSDDSDKIANNEYNFKRKIASILTTDISSDGYETFIMSNWDNVTDYAEEGGYDGEPESDSEEEFVNSDAVSTIDSTAATADIASAIPQKDYVLEENIEVYMKTIDISIALHDSTDEWLPCNIIKVSEDETVDLGLLQLADKQTPNTVVNIINLDNAITDDNDLHPGEKAVMIGYPLGEDLALTSSGMKVQLYNGQISKESDGNKIQYSVTSTHGASGAPVFNQCGQLIAVNFSGVDQVQGFNFGVVAKKIRYIYQ